MLKEEGSVLESSLVHNFSAPILFHYVWWILREAQYHGLHTLYFLARDGFLLLRIAEKFCQQFHLSIECRYLYCSRASLRMPSYHLIGDEAYDLLLLGGYRVSLKSLLLRAELDATQRMNIYQDCGLDQSDEDRLLSCAELDEVRWRLKRSGIYREFVERGSRAAYGDTIAYLHQEGLFMQDTIAVVDSGWTGSMQRSLRQLLESAGFQGRLVGFYFGMYGTPKSLEDGVYDTWYFAHRSGIRYKIPFCNNLFECLLSAPHGMTIGYAMKSKTYVPVTLPPPNGPEQKRIQLHIDAVLQYTGKRLESTAFEAFDEKAARRDTHQRIVRYMAYPSKEEAAAFGGFLFCDDTTEAYSFRLADSSQVKSLKRYSIPARVFRKVFSQKGKTEPELFWPFGTIAFLPRWKQWWYRWNVFVWEWIRYALH